MADVFISYAKGDNQTGLISSIVAQIISTPSPINSDDTITAWFDEQGIRKGEHWEEEIHIGLEEAHTVAIFISPKYFASMVCNQELEKAIHLGKKLIPIWVAEVRADSVEQEIDNRTTQGKETASIDKAIQNYITLRDKQSIRLDFDQTPDKTQTVQEFVTAIFENARLDDGATEWLQRALTKERGTGSWLSGDDLKVAEVWLAEAEQNPQFLIHEQTREYIQNSRKAQTRQMLTLSASGIIALMVIFVVAFIAQDRARTAQVEGARNESLRLAALANNELEDPDGNSETAALLAINALNTAYTEQADSSLQRSIERVSAVQIYEGHEELVSSVSFSADGAYILTGSWNCTVRLWETSTAELIQALRSEDDCHYTYSRTQTVNFTPDGLYILAAVGPIGSYFGVKVWDSQTFELSHSFEQNTVPFLSGQAANNIVFDAAGQQSILASDQEVAVFDVDTGNLIRRIGTSGNDLDISPNDQHIVISRIGSSPGFSADAREYWLEIIDSETGDVIHHLDSLENSDGHLSQTTSVDYSPDGQFILSGALNASMILWSAETGELIRRFNHSDSVWDTAFSPDGQHVLGAATDGTMRLWETATGQLLNIYEGHTDAITSIAFSPDGNYILSGSNDSTARLWLTNPEPITNSYYLSSDTDRVQFFPNNPNEVITLASTSQYLDLESGRQYRTALASSIQYLDLDSGEQLQTFESFSRTVENFTYIPENEQFVGVSDWRLFTADAMNNSPANRFTALNDFTTVRDAVFTSDGQFAFTFSSGATVSMWHIETQEIIQQFSSQNARSLVTSLALSPNEQFLAVSYYGRINIFAIDSGEIVRGDIPDIGDIDHLAYSPDGTYILGSSYQQKHLWRANTIELLPTFDSVNLDPNNYTTSTHFHPNTDVFAEGLRDGRIQLQSINGDTLNTIEGHGSAVNELDFSSNGELLVASYDDGLVHIWSTETYEIMHTFSQEFVTVSDVQFSPDNTSIFMGSNHGILVWDINTEEISQTITIPPLIEAIAVSPDGHHIVGSSNEHQAVVWDTETGQIIARPELGHSIRIMTYSPDGRYLLVGEDRNIVLWDAHDFSIIREFDNFCTNCISYNISDLSVSSDGQYALGSFRDEGFINQGFAVVWSMVDGSVITDYKDHEGNVVDVDFSPDGLTAMTGSWDDTVRLWNTITGETQQIIEEWDGGVTSVAFSNDGRYILGAGGVDYTIVLWDATSGEKIREFDGHPDTIISLEFSDDDTRFLSASHDGTVRLWYTDYRDSVTHACSRLVRDLTEEERELYGIPVDNPTCDQFATYEINLPEAVSLSQLITVDPSEENESVTTIEDTEEDNTIFGTIIASQRINLRASASTTATVVGGVEPDEIVTILDENDDGDWLLIRTPDDLEAWIFSTFVNR